MPTTIVTLTRFPEIFYDLADSIDRHENTTARRIVITSGGAENGLQVYGSRPLRHFGTPWERCAGPEPFCFARNANLGIAAAGRDDVLLTNDDVQFTSPMLDILSRICEENPSIGLLSPQIIGDGINNMLAQASTNLGDAAWLESPAYVPFVCVYLPRRALDIVGPLDESFTGYGGDDEDWSARAQKAGFKLAVTPLAKVVHGFGDRHYSSSFLRVMTTEERERSCQQSMAKVRELHA